MSAVAVIAPSVIAVLVVWIVPPVLIAVGAVAVRPPVKVRLSPLPLPRVTAPVFASVVAAVTFVTSPVSDRP